MKYLARLFFSLAVLSLIALPAQASAGNGNICPGVCQDYGGDISQCLRNFVAIVSCSDTATKCTQGGVCVVVDNGRVEEVVLASLAFDEVGQPLDLVPCQEVKKEALQQTKEQADDAKSTIITVSKAVEIPART